ncbi:hypothetical protein [Desulforhopalus sp. IMCC35007]|uniref:hypothetical protein n=1 Tax=Desulforhopalus sp. IMCC35007 TaxID=2569543 RepID=UPI0010AE1A10|nr:hypothetical protein [Desulforhopalus sp. IMCC35007]TKB11324.1 hypothetical protein FCL48_04765 [Desulforhopalus sp. IMCC35007]
MKNTILSNTKILLLSVLILISLGLSGCADMGRVVSLDKQILFQVKGDSRGNFESGKLSLDYSYNLVGENMKLSGVVNYYDSADSLTVRLLFLDGSGGIIQQKIIYYSGYRVSRSRINDRAFRTSFKVPPDALGISFDYSAQPRSSQK